MDSSELLEIFSSRGALLEGHFGLTSGRHSTTYLQCAVVLQYPDLARKIGIELARTALEAFGRSGPGGIDIVLSPAVGGIVIGQETAAGLGARAVFCERVDGVMQLRRGFGVGKGDRVLAVEDVVTTGGSIREAVQLAAGLGATVAGTASIVHRYSDEPVRPTELPHVCLLSVHAPAFDPSDCPLCREGHPFVKPGSRHLDTSKEL